MAEEQLDGHLMGIIPASLFPLKKGIGFFGERVETATTKELQAIYNMGTYEPQYASKPTKQDKHGLMESLSLITEQNDGQIKSRK